METGGHANRQLIYGSTGQGAFASCSYDAIAGWDLDDLGAAFEALRASLLSGEAASSALRQAALQIAPDADPGLVRRFFEQHYQPVPASGGPRLVTGYYEPVVSGTRRRHGRYQVPVYKTPDDLVVIAPDLERAEWNGRMSAGRRVGETIVPYCTRAEIAAGALSGRGLALCYLDDPIALFYMQVQGSGLVHLAEGGTMRLSYAAKTGHAYTSIGGLLIARGEIAAAEMSMAAVKAWLAQDAGRAQALLNENESYIFFRELDADADGPAGAAGVRLTPGRSLAVDGSLYPMGTPIFVSAPGLHDGEDRPFARLMIAQDVGSAIKGAQRGDIFWGSGEAAGALAGQTRHAADFIVLRPNGMT